MPEAIDKALKAKRESKHVEFKRSLDPSSAGEWCELIKDIVAMSNSGGGVIVVGLENNGSPSGASVDETVSLDHAVIVDKIRKYTGTQFDGIEIYEAQKIGRKIAVFEISPSKVPVVFSHVGTYETEQKKQKNAFSVGQIYFRHGAKSEPGTSEDLRNAFDKYVDAIRREWLDGVKKVVKAPPGSAIAVFAGEVVESSDKSATPVRLVDDPNAPGYRLIDQDKTYPYRQTELIRVVNAMLPQGVDINSRDLLSVRRVYKVDADLRYFHKPKFGTPQYSDEFANWLVQQHKVDNAFFQNARDRMAGQN
ncbi:RNA-binding domain-containing protein [Arenimonas donghaensis]|uniref:RNA-binding domain-containing protein n=1 Tax=Arenimonas donghaensis TaxID=375061 RepID=UPI0009FCB01B|nr:RNA-binding domain-containing protein [Arenimonas donghaensis]